MKKLLLFLLLLSVLVPACKDDTCQCRSFEDCVGGKCVLKPNHFFLGGKEIVGDNLYWAVAPCGDTVVITINDFGRYVFYTKHPIWNNGTKGYSTTIPDYIDTVAENHLIFTSFVDEAELIPESWYPCRVDCLTTSDTLYTYITFCALYGSPAGPQDSCFVKLHR